MLRLWKRKVGSVMEYDTGDCCGGSKYYYTQWHKYAIANGELITEVNRLTAENARIYDSFLAAFNDTEQLRADVAKLTAELGLVNAAAVHELYDRLDALHKREEK
jgi:hypothetical protein